MPIKCDKISFNWKKKATIDTTKKKKFIIACIVSCTNGKLCTWFFCNNLLLTKSAASVDKHNVNQIVKVWKVNTFLSEEEF